MLTVIMFITSVLILSLSVVIGLFPFRKTGTRPGDLLEKDEKIRLMLENLLSRIIIPI